MAHYFVESPMYNTIEELNKFANDLEAKRQQKALADLMGKMFNTSIPEPQEESWYQKPQQPAQEASPWNRTNGDPRIMNFPGSPINGPSAVNPDAQRPQSDGFNFMDAMGMLLQSPEAVQKAGGLGAVLQSLAPVQDAFVQERTLQQGDRQLDQGARKIDQAGRFHNDKMSLERDKLAREIEQDKALNTQEKQKIQISLMNARSLADIRAIQGEYYKALADKTSAEAETAKNAPTITVGGHEVPLTDLTSISDISKLMELQTEEEKRINLQGAQQAIVEGSPMSLPQAWAYADAHVDGFGQMTPGEQSALINQLTAGKTTITQDENGMRYDPTSTSQFGISGDPNVQKWIDSVLQE